TAIGDEPGQQQTVDPNAARIYCGRVFLRWVHRWREQVDDQLGYPLDVGPSRFAIGATAMGGRALTPRPSAALPTVEHLGADVRRQVQPGRQLTDPTRGPVRLAAQQGQRLVGVMQQRGGEATPTVFVAHHLYQPVEPLD